MTVHYCSPVVLRPETIENTLEREVNLQFDLTRALFISYYMYELEEAEGITEREEMLWRCLDNRIRIEMEKYAKEDN